MLHSNKIPLAKTGIYACGVSHQTGVASAKPDTVKQENSMACVDLYRLLLAERWISLSQRGKHRFTGILRVKRRDNRMPEGASVIAPVFWAR